MAATLVASDWSRALAEVLDEPARVQPVFQPIFDLQRGTVCGFEMLARFASARHAAPDEWFAAAAREGVGARLEAALVAAGLEARDALPENCFLSVNVGPVALLSDEVAAVLAGRDLSRVVVEVTESAPVEDYEALVKTLGGLRAAGAAIAVDDAGAGYASLRHVMRIRPEFVKLDRDLVQDVDRDPAKHALVETFGALAGRLDAWLVAEGLERPGEREVLAGMGVPLAQGFVLGRPAAGMDARRRVPAAPGSGGGLADLLLTSVPVLSLADLARTDPAPGHELAVAVDAHRRPVAVLVRGPGGWHANRAPLCVLPDEAPADVAHRALTRERHARFDPVCCIDPHGRLVGLLPFEQLVRRLANHPERTTP